MERRATSNPDAVAVIDGNHQITYAELEAAGTALARELEARGVGRDAVVALCLSRSAEQIIASLAIMKAGAAYLPLDPSHPRERLEFILSDAGVDVLVAGADFCALFVDKVRHCIVLTTNEPIAAHFAVSPSDLDARDLAYVIYTSGSTGRPKGVEITHASLMNLVDWHVAAFNVTDVDRASHLAQVGFDAAGWEVWPYLIAGATIVIGDPALMQEPEALRDWLCRNHITLCYASAPIAERLLQLAWPAPVALRILLTGADRLHTFPPATLPFEVVNNYGPTEATVVTTSGRVPAGCVGGFPSIGLPIRNARVYVVDSDGNRAAPGVEGELWLGGAGVARGYRNRPSLNAAVFGPDLFDATPGARIFRSGDRGRVLPSGELAFAGRIDQQLNVRGYRVEPAEIEQALNEHDAIVASAVIARDNDGHDTKLVAYFEAPAQPPALRELRTFLMRRLPAYMVPALFVPVARLPLSENGKVDRAALAALGTHDSLADEAYVAPRTPTETRIAAIVAPLLKLESVSVDDNLFVIGGHSLLGTQIIARIRDAFGVRIGLRFLFDSPTVAALAAEVDRTVVHPQERSAASAPAAASA
ncbi:MAG: non-ribosomal peptide synthetase [Candidatus Eremiobacteraeota bacterium]|nr:non-ribosomal peptide synthetase [Candidatus Eremiobacteraeota bacterium]MBC5803025.1 non-ribosomal peptide synthetase [Candidatus Eremiobacteraeota bacterium]MBC5821342.1 non-ribosomal peptide synthetase [Candidatus Eremiobacteraeota bacterium]